MGLNWDTAGVKNKDEVCFIHAAEDDKIRGIKAGDKLLNPVTEGIIWLTMATGVGWGITEENVEEFVARADLWQRVNGAYLNQIDRKGQATPRPITPDEIRAHVGLKTNVSYEPRADFLARLWAATYASQKLEPGQRPYTVWFDDDDCFETYAVSDDSAILKAQNWHVELYGHEGKVARVEHEDVP